jgi:hypothetical protein
MAYKFLPQQIPNVTVQAFNFGTSTQLLDQTRSRRLFGVVNTSANVEMEVRLNDTGSGDAIILAHKTNANRNDGGSLEFNGYNGAGWVLGEGFVYYYEG